MSVLIVVESLFGNTRAVAEAVAGGLQQVLPEESLRVVSVIEPVPPLGHVSLLLVGGPTHAFSMTRAGTREDARRYGSSADTSRGLRDWIDEASHSATELGVPVVTFDTRIRRIPGSAARSAARALRREGFSPVTCGESFWVTGTSGPLADGELDRACDWGRELAARLMDGNAAKGF